LSWVNVAASTNWKRGFATTDIGSKLASATFGVDAALLRAILDQLRSGLERPLVSTSTAVTAHDVRAVATSIRDILEGLATVDLSAMQALSGIVREYRTEDQAGQLREVFAALQDGWRDRVRIVLGREKIPCIARLLASPAPDLLRVLGKEDDENSHSDLIAWLLSPWKAPVIAPHALSRLAGRLGEPEWLTRLTKAIEEGTLSVRREVVITREFGGGDDLARVDITVSGPGFVLAIENKVWSREHSDQTRAYWRWLEPLRCLRGGLLLSPSGMPATCPEFKAISYLELASCLVEGASIGPITESEEIILASYLKTLARKITQVEMRAVKELEEMEQR